MSDAMLAIMRGPDRDVFNANVPRLVVEDDGDHLREEPTAPPNNPPDN